MRYLKDRISSTWMIICMIFVILMPFLVGVGLYYKSEVLLFNYNFWDLLFSSDWKPLSGKFGFFSFILSSLWVTFFAILFSAPICLFASIYLTQYARNYVLRLMHPIIDILAGIPSVVYGVWGILIIVPAVSAIAPLFGIETSGYTILAGSVVLSVMCIPFILNILIEVFKAIPQELSEASLSLGATKWETVKFILVRKAFPGIISAIGLGVSRAFGETIAVLMVVGNVIQIPHSLFDAGYPLPALIANNYGEMLSIPLYDSALMLSALILFVVVLIFNFFSRVAISRIERNN